MKKITTLVVLIGCLFLTACSNANDIRKSYDINKNFNKNYIDEKKLPILDLHIDREYVSGDRKLILDDSIENPVECLVYDFYRDCMSGDYEKVYEIIAEEDFLNAIKNEEKAFKNGIYLSEIYIDEIDMVDKDELDNISVSNQQNLIELLDKLKMEEFAIVEVECAIKHNDKSMSQAPQVGNGDITRYYLVGKTENKYKICNVYWEGFIKD